MLSLGTEFFLAFWMASYSVGLPAGSPPPTRAATSMFLISRAKFLPRRASMTAFLCFVVAHLEWPLMQVLPLSCSKSDHRVYGDIYARRGRRRVSDPASRACVSPATREPLRPRRRSPPLPCAWSHRNAPTRSSPCRRFATPPPLSLVAPRAPPR